MNIITLCLSAHRSESLQMAARIMQDHDVIILEEPSHPDLTEVLEGNIDIKEYLLDFDTEYPQFMERQYRLLRQFHKMGKAIIQEEPYLECLLHIHHLFAEGNSPDDIEANTTQASVYLAERAATDKLIGFYKMAREGNFNNILASMNAFAMADASRFILRDTLRSQSILRSLELGKTVYIEAGSMHLLLYRLLARNLPEGWKLQMKSIDRMAVKALQGKGTLYSPGDVLTLHYIMGNTIAKPKWGLYCARALIYAKISKKEETINTLLTLPHTHSELETLAAVQRLSVDACRELFHRIRDLTADEAADAVQSSLQSSR